MNIYLGLSMAIFAPGLYAYVQVKRNREAKKILVKWLENEKIVQLLEKSQATDFIWQPRKDTNIFRLKMDCDHSKLLKEYVNDDKIFYKHGVIALQVYYINKNNVTEKKNYFCFKNKVEN
ncbi:MAG: hypothetical protein K2X94_05205 [Amoebophilaceae bacterium]|nr:hypothetical protein [Amoebophilaceae bacterium]